jgi:hypothetical protein
MRQLRVATAGVIVALVAGCGASKSPTPEAASLPASPSAAAPSVTSPSASPSASDPASTTAPATPAPASAAPIPKSIPATAFLQASDVPGKIKEKPRRLGPGDQPLPTFCGKKYGSGSAIQATQSVYFTEPNAPAGSTPKAAIYQDVLVYRGDGAASFLNNLRASVRRCATQKDEVGVTVKNYLRGSLDAGDDSVLIERTRPATDDAGEPVGGGSRHHLFWAAVRVDDSVTFVSNTGWESISAERGDTEQLGRRAATRLAAWRH